MSKRKPKRSASRHINQLIPSLAGHITLCGSVQERFLDLCGSYLRIRGDELIPPSSLDADMLRWRQMAVRYQRGDYRHTEAELESLKTIAQWTVDCNRALRNQPSEQIQWLDE